MRTTELAPYRDSRKSFYRKAFVVEDVRRKTLISYTTPVAYVEDGALSITPEVEANAKLISLAPELLEASKGILKHLHTVCDKANIEDNHAIWAYMEDLNDAVLRGEVYIRASNSIRLCHYGNLCRNGDTSGAKILLG